MSKFSSISVGQVLEHFTGLPDQTRMAMNDEGYFEIYVINNNLKEDEIEQYNNGKPAQFGLVHLKGIVLLLIKFGSNSWMDVPYNPNVGNMPLILDDTTTLGDDQHLLMSLVLIEARTGEVKHLRAIGLDSRYSNALLKVLRAMKMEDLPQDEYHARLQQIYRNYQTKDLIKYSLADFKVRV